MEIIIPKGDLEKKTEGKKIRAVSRSKCDGNSTLDKHEFQGNQFQCKSIFILENQNQKKGIPYTINSIFKKAILLAFTPSPRYSKSSYYS